MILAILFSISHIDFTCYPLNFIELSGVEFFSERPMIIFEEPPYVRYFGRHLKYCIVQTEIPYKD